jgi:hypothetical protein
MAISIDLAIGSVATSGGGGGGSVNTGVLQVSGGGALSGTLQTITDQSSNTSPLQLSTTSVSFGGSTGLNWDNANKRLGIGTNTPLGILHLKTAAAATRLVLDGDAAQNKIITYRTAGVQRFGLYTNNTAESGSNAGSDFAIRAYSDAGTLLSTPIFIKRSTGFVGIGTTTTSARLHVRGDGTNAVGRFESSAGNSFLLINNSGQSLFGSAGANEPYLVNYNGTNTESGSGQSLRIRQRANTGATGNTLIQYWADGLFSGTTSGTAVSHEFLSSGFLGSSAGSANYRNATFAYTINNSGAQTGTATGIFLNATETALNGMGHNLLDLQVGAASRFRVSNNGQITIGSLITFGNGTIITTSFNGILRMSNDSGVDFNRLQLGGTTNAFPAIKRNGAAIDFRLADDSGFCGISASTISSTGISSFGSGVLYVGANFVNAQGNLGIGFFGNTVASALVEMQSTTRGFLPPRMTTTQKNAIATPAEGLIVHDTTNNGVSYFDGTNWGYLSGAKQNLTGAGGTLNVPFRNGNIVDLALNSSTTLTFGSHVVGTYIIEVTQGGTGSNTLTFPASVKWSGGVPPTLTTVVGKTDVLTFFYDGTFFYGTYSLNY